MTPTLDKASRLRKRQWASALLASIAVAVVGANAAQSNADADKGASSCSRGETREALDSFVVAFNRGDYAALDLLFAQPPVFRWYSSPKPGQRIGAAAKRRGTLIPYFRTRHARQDRLRFLAFGFTGRAARWSNLWFEMRRSAADFRQGKWIESPGKGAVACDGGSAQFIVMSLGGPAPIPVRSER
jgi:hypothetical protein